MKNKVIRWIILGATVVAVGVAGFYAIAFNVDKKLNEDMFAKQDNVIIEYNDSEENIDIKQEDVSNVDTDQDIEVAKEEVKEEVNGFEFGDISSGDDYIDELAAANVVLAIVKTFKENENHPLNTGELQKQVAEHTKICKRTLESKWNSFIATFTEKLEINKDGRSYMYSLKNPDDFKDIIRVEW